MGDSVEVCTWDELDEVGLDVEEHPVKNDAVITISPATIGIDFFISPTIHQRWERYTQDDTLLNWATLRRALCGADVVVSCELLHNLFPGSPESLALTRVNWRRCRPCRSVVTSAGRLT